MNLLSQYYAYFDFQTIILLILLVYSIYWLQNLRNLPPGPWGLPILGYFPFLTRDLTFKTITKLSRSYGNVISIQLGNRTVIFLNDYEAIKEGFASSYACAFRPPREMFDYILPKDHKYLVGSEGERATQHRRFMLATLKEFGMGKQSLEPKILDEVSHLIEAIKSLNGEPTDLSKLFVISTANVIWLLEYGRRFEYTDELFKRILSEIDKFTREAGVVNFEFFLPWLQYVPIVNLFFKGKAALTAIETMQEIFRERLQHRKSTYVTGDKNDYVDAYLTERANHVEKNGNEGFFDLEELVGNMGLLFGAGMETTAYTMLWGIIYLIRYPREYEKIDIEIQNIIGRDRMPSLSDKQNMPYTQAFLMEVFRSRPTLPLSLYHSNAEKTTVCGKPIPKRSLIVGNIWAVHHDSKIWGDPDVFRPERFIDEKGQLKKSEYVIPFSIGKRNCVGESLAQMELFLTFTSLCQRFKFETEEGIFPNLDGDLGLTYKPKPHKIRGISK